MNLDLAAEDSLWRPDGSIDEIWSEDLVTPYPMGKARAALFTQL
jgi:hypothetical protein